MGAITPSMGSLPYTKKIFSKLLKLKARIMAVGKLEHKVEGKTLRPYDLLAHMKQN
jgi:hypothetical protein